MTSADDACSGYRRRGFLTLSVASGASAWLFHLVTLLRGMSQCANFAGMGNDNKGNRIAFGTPTTDCGFMQGEYFAGRNADQVAQAGRRARMTLPCIIGFVAGCAAGAALEAKFGLWALVLPVALGVIAIPLSETSE